MPVLVSQKRGGGVVFFYVKVLNGELVVLRSFNSSPPDGFFSIINMYFGEDVKELIIIT